MFGKPGITEGSFEERAAESARQNHICVNAFTIVSPTDKTLLAIGRAVVEKLKDPDCRTWSEHRLFEDDDTQTLADQSVIIRLNAS